MGKINDILNTRSECFSAVFAAEFSKQLNRKPTALCHGNICMDSGVRGARLPGVAGAHSRPRLRADVARDDEAAADRVPLAVRAHDAG